MHLATVSNDFFRQGNQLFHGLGHFIARILEVLRAVPNQTLHVCLVGEGEELGGTVLVLVGAKRHPALSGSIVGLDEVGGVVTKRNQEPLGGEIGQKAGLGKDRDIGRAASLRIDHDLLFIVL
jgi:hypothetical protein